MSPDQARNLLLNDDGTPTPVYAAYLQYLEQVNAKQKEMDEAAQNARSNPMLMHSWPMVARTYSDNVQKANDQLTVLGRKNDVDQAIDTLRAVNDDAVQKLQKLPD